MTPPLSVVVPTHDRRDAVVRLLDTIARDIAAAALEVIVVADGCTDDTVATLRARRDPFALRVVEQVPAGGPGRARDLGARHARGETLAFIDDDIELFPGALDIHARLHAAARARGEELLVIGAPVPLRARSASYHDIAAWGWWEQQFERMREPGHRFTYDEVFTGVLSLPALVFHEVGGFDAAFSECHEDSELGLRLLRRGMRVAFVREAGGIHHEVRDLERLIPRKSAEGRADVLLAQRYPELWTTLRLAQPASPAHTPLGALRRAAFDAPALGDLFAATLRRLLPMAEALGMRGTWRMAQAGVMYYHYWRGAARAAGGRAAFETLAAHGAAATAAWDEQAWLRTLDVDLADGLDAAGSRVEAARPLALRVWLGATFVGSIDPSAGAEPLRDTHLRPLLARLLAAPLRLALAIDHAREAPVAEPRQAAHSGTEIEA